MWGKDEVSRVREELGGARVLLIAAATLAEARVPQDLTGLLLS